MMNSPEGYRSTHLSEAIHKYLDLVQKADKFLRTAGNETFSNQEAIELCDLMAKFEIFMQRLLDSGNINLAQYALRQAAIIRQTLLVYYKIVAFPNFD